MEPELPLPRVMGVQTDDLAELYAAACPRLIGLLIVLGGNAADAEEVAQEAFVRLLQKWSTVREYDDPEAWVRLVAVRMMIDRHRRRRVAGIGLGRLRPLAAADPRPEDRLDLAAGLARLPVHHRAVVLLHHVHDLPVDDVARQLGVPVGTVKSRLARARTALAPMLADETRSTT